MARNIPPKTTGSPAAPARNLNAARTYQVIGWTMRVFAVIAIFSVALLPIGVLLLAGSYWVLRRGKKHAVALADDVLANDTRPPVLYLRSFNDEQDDSRLGRFLQPGDHDIAQSTPAWGPREQDAMAPIMAEIGPYVAIGKPRELLPELGAARTYVSDDDWQAKILEWLARARLVIVRAGATEGLRWEVDQLVARAKPTQVLVILPPKAEHYQGFARWANQVLPHRLPDAAPTERLIIFDASWRPILLPPRTTIKKTLAPYFEQNGIALRKSFFNDFLEHNGLR